MIALAHVEASRAGDEFGIAIVALALGRDGAAAIAGLLQRHAVLATFRDVEKGAPVRPQQPLVSGEDEEVGVEAAHVDVITPAACVASTSSIAPCRRSAAATRSISTAPPSDQCTDEIEARPTGDAPGRSIAASTAVVQSPAAGRGTTSTVNRPAAARVVHSSTADEWSFSSTSTREAAGTVMSLAAVATP